MKGGKRDGSGRKPNIDRIKYAFKIERTLHAWMRDNLKLGNYSEFINQAIKELIEKIK